jgi:hypothetical protein
MFWLPGVKWDSLVAEDWEGLPTAVMEVMEVQEELEEAY